jgi:hypothetical protein
LMQSLPLIGQPAAAAAGYQGAGCFVAVLDTGRSTAPFEFGDHQVSILRLKRLASQSNLGRRMFSHWVVQLRITCTPHNPQQRTSTAHPTPHPAPAHPRRRLHAPRPRVVRIRRRPRAVPRGVCQGLHKGGRWEAGQRRGERGYFFWGASGRRVAKGGRWIRQRGRRWWAVRCVG